MFNFFGKRAVGIDIADRTVEVVEVARIGRRLKLRAAGWATLPPGVVVRGRIKDEARLREAVRAALAAARPRPIAPRLATIALPESQIFFHSVILPAGTKPAKSWFEEARAIAEKNFPIPADDLHWNFRRINLPSGASQLFLAATRQSVAREWSRFLDGAGISVENYDLEPLAVARAALAAPTTSGLTAVVDIGSTTIMVTVFSDAGPLYAYELDWGGEQLTAAIAETFKLSGAAAEEQKIRLGLSPAEPSLSLLLTRRLEPLLIELRATDKYLSEHFGARLDAISLAGGGARLIGLTEFLARNLNLPVSILSLPDNLVVARELEALIHGDQGLYVEAFGLALRPLYPEKFRDEISLSVIH